jgi:hypothetical protein
MPSNIFSFFDAGTWESYGSGVEVIRESNTGSPSATLLAELQKVTGFSSTGSASGRLTFKNFKTNAAIYCANCFATLVGYASPPRPTTAIFAGMGGKEFRLKAKVMTPSSNPIGSPDLNIRIAPGVSAFPAPFTNTLSPISFTKVTVADITDVFAEVEYRFIVQDNNAFYISLVADDSSLRTGDLPAGVPWDRAGTLNLNGVLYFDDVTIIEVVSCNLAYGSPSYTKTDETGVGANDCSITVNATSSFNILYSLDDVTYQVSNVFLGLAPGIYTVYVKDLNDCVLPPITNIPLLEFVPPSCDLNINSVITTNETGVGLNNGSATINVSSSKVTEFSIDNFTWQGTTLFSGLAPGNYTVYVRNTDLTCPASQPFVILAYLAPPVAGPLGVNLCQVNSYNFISWFLASGQINFSSLDFTNCRGCATELPNAYNLNKKKTNHYPVIVNAEGFSFYINFDEDYSYANFSSLRLDVITPYGVLQQNVAPLKRVFQADGLKYFIYADVTLNGLAPGYYRLAIIDTSTPAPFSVRFVSQELEVMTQTEAPKFTASFQFKASIDIYRFLYTGIPDFYQRIRLRVNELYRNTDGTISQYRAATTGKLRNTAFDLDLFYGIEAYYFDKLAVNAMFVFQVDDIIILNNKSYIVKTVFKPQWEVEETTWKGIIEMYEQAFSTANRYGDPDAIIIQDPALMGDGGGSILI